MNHLPDDFVKSITELEQELSDRLVDLKKEGEKDLIFNEFDLDKAIFDVPRLKSKWLNKFTDETLNLKNLYGLKEQVRLERWKYYGGKQTDEYCSRHGILHEKILKTDIDKYMTADIKLTKVNDMVNLQKAITDYIEEVLKEIGNRGFHIKAMIEYRKFISGS